MSSEVLHVERRGRAALLTIDRPHAGNSINAEVTAALDEAIDALAGEREPVAIVITGAGSKFFSSGGGAELMLACDIRLAAPAATIGFPYVHLGLIPGWHGTERLTRNCGYANALHLLAAKRRPTFKGK